MINDLLKAVRDDSVEQIARLISNGVDVNLANYLGQTALMAVKNGPVGVEIAKLLIKAGADVNQLTSHGHSALHDATAYGDIELMTLLIKEGAVVDQADKFGITPFLYPGYTDTYKTEKELKDTFDFLVNNGADIHKVDRNNRGAIAIAEYHKNHEVTLALLNFPIARTADTVCGIKPLLFGVSNVSHFKNLVKAGVDIHEVDNYNNTALFIIVSSDKVSRTKFLIKNGIDINHQNRFGKTAIMTAANKTNDKQLMILLDAGANLLLKDNDGKTVLDYLYNKDLTPLLEKKMLEQDSNWDNDDSPGL